jgi:AAA domain
MSNIIVILGESGTGKSTSFRNLDAKETFIINVLNKPLPFRGYKKLYNENTKNYLESDSYKEIMAYLNAINERRPDIKIIIIDDFSFLMNNEFMRRCRETGYSKYSDMGLNMFEIMEQCKTFRPDLYCFIMCHTERDHAGIIKPKTVGKMTADYVGIAERVSIVLHTQVVDNQYKFLTQFDGEKLAKSPLDMFDSVLIDNDLQQVKQSIENYYNDGEE